jgi:antitoxin HicB
MSKHIGSSLNEFLAQEDLLVESELIAVKRIIASQIEEAMHVKNISKTRMAQSMGTSRAALERLLDYANTSITLYTLEKAAHAVGKRLHVSIT